jgi:PAS domain S-box-containing protein
MQSFDEPWSSSEVRKILNLFDADYRLARDIIDALPIPIAVVAGPDLHVRTVNAAFRDMMTRVPGYTGFAERVAERLFRDSDVGKKGAIACSTGIAQRYVRIPFATNERFTATIIPVGHRDQFVVVLETPDALSAGGAAETHEFDLLQAIPAAIYTRDTNGTIRYANPAFERLTGFKVPELLSSKLPDIQRNGDGPARDLSRPVQASIDLVTKRGETLPVTITERLVGQRAEFIGVVDRRETDSIEAEEEAVMDALERVSGQISHRFNNLLTIVLSYADMISNRFGSVESLRSDVGQIVEAGTKAAELTAQLLTFSRGRPGDAVATDITPVLREFRSLLEGVLADDVRLTMNLASDVGPVYINPHDVETVLLNLVANANDAIDGPGEIVVSTYAGVPEEADAPERHAEMAAQNRSVTMSVRDSGRGIAEDFLPRVFEPFATTKSNRAGLGLSVVYGIVKKAGGVISIASTAGSGTTVWITLPEAPGASR